MEDRQTALALVLDYLEIPLSVDSVADRMAMQKAIYLVQKKGIALGYTYGWYLKGPYSPSLTRDYYDLISSGEGVNDQHELKDTVKAVLRDVKGWMSKRPPQLSLSHWLELLASLAFLRDEQKLVNESIKEKMAETKGHLVPYLDDGFKALQ